MKYKLTNETKIVDGHTLHRIECVESFDNVHEGDKGGWIEKEENLLQDGYCWIYDDACVYEDAQIRGNAQIANNAKVHGKAWVFCDAQVYGDAEVYGSAEIFEDAQVYGDAQVCGSDQICGYTNIYEKLWYIDEE